MIQTEILKKRLVSKIKYMLEKQIQICSLKTRGVTGNKKGTHLQ